MAKKRKLNVINFILFVIIIILSIILVVTLFILGKLYFEQRSNEREENNTTDNVVETIEPTPIVEQTTKPVVRYTNNYDSDNCTTAYNELMLINANYDVSLEFIEERKEELVDITALYGILEAGGNGTPYLDEEAASHLNDMVNDYRKAYEGHDLQTLSCFRAVGTTCGRLCATTTTSDHHTGYTCDLVDPSYGTRLNTDLLDEHVEWQWLIDNSYKYGFILRFPENWAGGSMDEPINVDENGTTGYYETWHFRYVGLDAAYDIAKGVYNNGEYDSLEHYLLATDMVNDLKIKDDSCPYLLNQ